MQITDKNIRATALHEFWGEEYPESLYLWHGAKHNGTLADIEKNTIPTHKDLFSTQEEIQKGHEFCKNFYYRMLPELADRLNKVHGLNRSVSFWQVVFGYWLYRHICVVYDKYVCLSSLDIDETSIKLLSVNDFYIPQNHCDYLSCFACDFGVQQLVSQYYYIYKQKDFHVVNKKFTSGEEYSDSDVILNKLRRKLSFIVVEPQVALVGVYLGEKTRRFIHRESYGKINNLVLPVTKKNPYEVDVEKRRCMSNGVIEKSFESYFIQSLYYCLPKDFIEYFAEYYDIFQKDIKTRKFTHIVAECWISRIPDAIYVALSKEDKRVFVSYEHGASNCYYENSMKFIEYDVADIFLSVGWKINKENFVQGGFTCRDIITYKQDRQKNTILFVSTSMFIYLEELNERGATNSIFIKNLKMLAIVIDLFPISLKDNLIFRPRPENIYWDVESLLEIDQLNIKIDRGNFAESVSKSKIVIIDHMSTGFAEILLMKVPFILVYDINSIGLSGEFKELFDDLIGCGVVHTSAQSAVSHLSCIYEHVDDWWQSEPVRISINKLIDCSLAPPTKTTDFLLSLVVGNFVGKPSLLNRIWIWVFYCAMLVLDFGKLYTYLKNNTGSKLSWGKTSDRTNTYG